VKIARLYMFFLVFLLPFISKSQQIIDSSQFIKVYLFPGQGSDYRLYNNLALDPCFDTIHVSYPMPEPDESVFEFSKRILPQIDTNKPFVLIGVSLGGMICTELADVINPKKIIVVSSAKCKSELPGHYTFQQKIPLNKIVPKEIVKMGAVILQPLVEPDRNENKETFVDMLTSKDPTYLKRTVDMIINWQRTSYSEKIIHIHGDNDHTISVDNVKYDFLIENGSHMIMLTRGDELSILINEILLN